MKLRDADLLRTRAFIGGKWVDATNGATRQVGNPATGEPISAGPDLADGEGRPATEAPDRGRRPGIPGVDGWDRQGARGGAASLVRAADGEPRGPGHPDDRRTGQ